MLRTSLQKPLQQVVKSDWSSCSFDLSAEEYDLSLLQPVTFASLGSLRCDCLSTDEAKLEMSMMIAEEYCRMVEEELLKKKFTECGGLLLKRLVRSLQEELVNELSDEVMGCSELHRLLLFSILTSAPIETTDVSEIIKTSQVPISQDECNTILDLRIAQHLIV